MADDLGQKAQYRHAPKVSIEMRQSQLNKSKPAYVASVVEPVLEELAREFWANEHRVRVDGNEIIDFMIGHVEKNHAQMDEADRKELLESLDKISNKPNMVEADIQQLRKECDLLAGKCEEIWKIEKQQIERRKDKEKQNLAGATNVEANR
ncbi:unnamed protein product [Amoebophrya sp. A25]|nr:unnamed protein product [Amoebophrya sp. A25]|eukprot:GSA25T00025299001.1